MDLRKRILAERDKLPETLRAEFSRRIKANLFSLDEFSAAKLLMLFCSFRSEVDTFPIISTLLQQKRRVVLPVTDTKKKELKCYLIKDLNDLKVGAFSIKEPDPLKCEEIAPRLLDIVVVPGSVFDRRGARFGYGGGFYDRFLSKRAPSALRIALAFSIQVMDYNIPMKPHDEFMDIIITEREVIRCDGRKGN